MAKKGQTVHITDLGPPVPADQPPAAAEPAAAAPGPEVPPSIAEPTARLNFPSGPLSRAGTPSPVAPPKTALPAIVEKPPTGWPVYLVASGAAAITALTPLFYVAGYLGGMEPMIDHHFMLAMVAVWAALPAIVVLMAAYMLQQGRRLAAEAQHTRELAKRLLAPTAMAAGEAGDMAELLRGQIADVVDAANLARERLSALRETMGQETARLNESAASASRSAAELAGKLGQERTEMAGLGQTLDTQSAKVADAIARQAQMVAEASDLAEAQLREAEAVLAARAADLAAAAGEASDAARIAGEDLDRQVGRLETAGLGVGDQMRLVGETITTQRAALVTAAHALRAEQEDFALAAETRSAQLSEFMVQARLGASEVGDSAGRGAQALSELIETARQKVAEFAEDAQAERQAMGEQAGSQLQALGEMFDERRRRLQAEFAGLNREADEAFEARMAQARDMVEGSALAVEQAGAAAVERIDNGLTEARRSLVEMQRLLAEIDERAARLPREAQGSLAQVRDAVGQGIDEILTQARRAAQETQAIDEAFQDRVRRNYEMLSEAVKLMGAASQEARLAVALPTELTRPQAAAPPPAADLPLRGRLKFSATDDPLDGLAEPAPAAGRPAEPMNLTWKEMISGLAHEEQGLGPGLVTEVRAMGIDPDALLPKSRIEDIATALYRGDPAAAREAVRKLAPAASRRLMRRLFSDADLRSRAERFLHQYAAALDHEVGRQGGVVVVASLLASDIGRSYLLLDAASGDLT